MIIKLGNNLRRIFLIFCFFVLILIITLTGIRFTEMEDSTMTDSHNQKSSMQEEVIINPSTTKIEFNSDPFNPSTTEIEFVNPITTDDIEVEFVPASENPLYRITCYSSSDGFPATNLVCRGGTVQEWVDYALDIGLDGICAAGGRTEWYSEAKHAHPPIILEITDHGRYLLVDRAPTTSSVIDIWVPWKAGVDGPMWNHWKEVKIHSGEIDY